MEIKGTIKKLLPIQEGTSSRGAWRKQDMILQTEGSYSKDICIGVWGDKIQPELMREGSHIIVAISIESREYNGRWYTDVKAIDIRSTQGAATSPEVPKNINDTEPNTIVPF